MVRTVKTGDDGRWKKGARSEVVARSRYWLTAKFEKKSVVWCKNTVRPPWPKRESKSVPFL